MQINDKGKFVTVKEDRKCSCCNKSILKGNIAFSISIVIREKSKSKRIRIWTHKGTCSEKYIPKLTFWESMGYPKKPNNSQLLF